MAGESNVTANVPTSTDRPRPKLKGHAAAYGKKHLAIAFGVAVLGGLAQKLLVNDPRKRAYAEFHKNYDIEAAYERMRKLGLFTHAGPDDE